MEAAERSAKTRKALSTATVLRDCDFQKIYDRAKTLTNVIFAMVTDLAKTLVQTHMVRTFVTVHT